MAVLDLFIGCYYRGTLFKSAAYQPAKCYLRRVWMRDVEAAV